MAPASEILSSFTLLANSSILEKPWRYAVMSLEISFFLKIGKAGVPRWISFPTWILAPESPDLISKYHSPGSTS